MTPQNPGESNGPLPSPAEPSSDSTIPIPGTLTLEPLRAEGPEALAAPDIPDFSGATLREIEIAWENLQQEVTIKRAADLFKTSDGSDPIPRSGSLTRAVLDLHFSRAQKPHKLEIVPPNTLKLDHPADSPAVVRLLTLKHFCLVQILLPFFLAAATALALGPGDDDPDEDDPDTDHPALAP